MFQEIWKDVKGYEGSYQVSNLGRVRSLDRYIIDSCGRKTFAKGKENLHITMNNCGYLFAKLSGKTKYIHIMVAECFVDGRFEGAEVNHKDLDKTNNCYTNLEWVTHSENQKHQTKAYGREKKYKYCKKCGKVLSSIHSVTSLCLGCLGSEKREYVHRIDSRYGKNNQISNEEFLSDEVKKAIENNLLIKRPDKDTLAKTLYEEKGNFECVGRKYGVNGNAVRSWCKFYNMSFHSKDYAPEKPIKIQYERIPVPVKQIDKKTKQIVKIWFDYLEAQQELGLNHLKEIIEHRSTRKSEGGYLWEKVTDK